MTSEIAGNSERVVPIGSDNVKVRDNGVPIQYVDVITELRHNNSVIYLSLASTVLEAGNKPLAVMAGRFRMDMGAAQNLHKHLGEVINAALSIPSSEKSN